MLSQEYLHCFIYATHIDIVTTLLVMLAALWAEKKQVDLIFQNQHDLQVQFCL
jgi:hypothetical protein